MSSFSIYIFISPRCLLKKTKAHIAALFTTGKIGNNPKDPIQNGQTSHKIFTHWHMTVQEIKYFTDMCGNMDES